MSEESTAATGRSLDELGLRPNATRWSRERSRETFFAELAPRLQTAKALGLDLDRHLAQRFNVLDYLRDDELGLSRIIADLLDPDATHGQRWLFLQAFLECLNQSGGAPLSTQDWSVAEETATVAVTTERAITDLRRIDVSVEIRMDTATYCLAFENKPYAHDQPNQVTDYLAFLEETYGQRFLLIYLSPTGEAPSEDSAPATELAERWMGRFAIMPFYHSEEDRDDGLVRTPKSFAAWLDECRHLCEVDRLRWFLRDAELFCERTFGGKAMVDNAERQAVLEFVMSAPEKLKTALAVYECWPDIRDEVCAQFLSRLCARVRQDPRLEDLGSDLTIDCRYDGEPKKRNRLWLHRDAWHSHPNAAKSNNPDSEHRWAVRLESDGPGPKGWFIGVLAPKKGSDLSEEERTARVEYFSSLTASFPRGHIWPPSWWAWYENLDEKTRDWNRLVPELEKECQEEDGPILRSLADRFVAVALKAVPKIDAIDGEVGAAGRATRV